jgi:hypothetical protein
LGVAHDTLPPLPLPLPLEPGAPPLGAAPLSLLHATRTRMQSAREMVSASANVQMRVI